MDVKIMGKFSYFLRIKKTFIRIKKTIISIKNNPKTIVGNFVTKKECRKAVNSIHSLRLMEAKTPSRSGQALGEK